MDQPKRGRNESNPPEGLKQILASIELDYLNPQYGLIAWLEKEGEKGVAELGKLLGDRELVAAQATYLATYLRNPAVLTLLEQAATHRYEYVRLSLASGLRNLSLEDLNKDEVRKIAEILLKDKSAYVAKVAQQTWTQILKQ